jgi:uncharacterized protein
MKIRRVEAKDLDTIVEINNSESKFVGEETKDFFKGYLNIPFFNVVEEKNKVIGFIMGMDQATDYDSENFLWFRDRIKEFYYIDRAVIELKERGKGLGTALYEELMKNRNKLPVVAEVALQPPNESSVRFHEKLGFKETGIFSAYGKTCRMYKLD